MKKKLKLGASVTSLNVPQTVGEFPRKLFFIVYLPVYTKLPFLVPQTLEILSRLFMADVL